MFNSDLAYDVWKAKYQQNNETLEEFFNRITNEFVRLDNFKNAHYLPEEILNKLSSYGQSRLIKDRKSQFETLFNNFTFTVPGGSVLSGVGSNKPVSLSNCFVLNTEDSIEAIFKSAHSMSEIYKRRGGVGIDLSVLRPAKATVNNAAKTTGGVVPFMELYSQVTNTIGQEGRRGALMISINIEHPDSPDFITAKQDLSKITGANVSVKLSDEFMEAVDKDTDYILRWPCVHLDNFDPDVVNSCEYNVLTKTHNIYNEEGIEQVGYVKRIKAKELWESIIHCAWNTAEPGILFWDTIINNDPASVYPQFEAVSTNPCGEIPLSPFDSCRLIATNLYSLVKHAFTETPFIDYDFVYKTFYEAQIIGDILVDLEAEAVQRIIDITTGEEQQLWINIKEIGLQGRRTGVGLMGLADMLAALGKNYTDFEFIETIMRIKLTAELDATIDLAIINQPFPAFELDREYYFDKYTDTYVAQNPFYQFIQDQFPEQFKRMVLYGRRNISWSTIAPTGSISILAGVSSGCEPVFDLYYTRRTKCNPGEKADFVDLNGVGFKNYNVIHPKFINWYLTTFPILQDIEPKELETLSKEELDELIKLSPWFNNTASELKPADRVTVQSILQKYTTHSISSTVNLPKEATENDVATIYLNAHRQNCKGITVYRDSSRSGILIKQEETKKIVTTRPIDLECKVMRFKNEKKNWIAFVGMINGSAYEIFSGVNDLDELPIPSYIESGKITKIATEEGSRYDFSYIDKYGYTNTVGGLNRIFDKEFWNYGRFVSALLIEQVPIQNIIKIISKLEFTNKGMNNWKSGIIRSLKGFVPDGTEAVGATCENESCKSKNIIYEGGCMVCRDCGSSHCG